MTATEMGAAAGWRPARNEFFAALFAAEAVNGLAMRVLADIELGAETISVVVVVGILLALRAAILAPSQPLERNDLLVGGVAGVMMLWPQGDTSLAAMTLVSAYLLLTEQKGTLLFASGAIALAATIPPLWGHLLPIFFSGILERFDLQLVSLITGQATHGNRLNFIQGDGGVVVAWACTSFANGSLALLLWVALTRTVRPMPKRGEWMNLLAVFATIFLINTVRLCLMTIDKDMYYVIHDQASSWFGLALLLSTIAWCAYGLRRELVR
jgi:exosortase/archaeosortase family protein